jgi:hypothetical protein
MTKYLIKTTMTYRVATVDEVEQLHEDLINNENFSLVGFGYKTKVIKQKGEIVEEYQLVTATVTINDEKEPEDSAMDVKIARVF